MSRPAKPFSVLTSENKSHRTKAELKQREDGEKALATGETLKERPEVKENPIAHKEFLRVSKLLAEIGKNDALHEPIINRYCELQAECAEYKAERMLYVDVIRSIRKTFESMASDLDVETRAEMLIELAKSIAKITASVDKIDGKIQSKRKMLFDIEKENIFTIASALRSIPKKVESPSEDPLLKALRGG